MKRCVLWLLLLMVLALPVAQAEQAIVVDGDRQPTVLEAGNPFRVKGSYAIEGVGATTFSDDSIFAGSAFAYLKTKESGEQSAAWFCPPGTHAPMLVRVNITNFSSENMKALERVQCELVYDGKYSIPATITQINPGQLDEKGQQVECGSLEPLGIPPMTGAELRILINTPLLVRDTDAPLAAHITVDGDEYLFPLRDILEIG